MIIHIDKFPHLALHMSDLRFPIFTCVCSTPFQIEPELQSVEIGYVHSILYRLR